jgi:hypothetical protein
MILKLCFIYPLFLQQKVYDIYHIHIGQGVETVDTVAGVVAPEEDRVDGVGEGSFRPVSNAS